MDNVHVMWTMSMDIEQKKIKHHLKYFLAWDLSFYELICKKTLNFLIKLDLLVLIQLINVNFLV
jgi:hypothetical protein